ncbi:type I restriction-modification enzyme R subunit C-terminal domain-containing protein [Clostridium sp. ZS2-4]|uniref:type I restriction-modification enzyme R subunit C-terminal domain-containing protein n=1 Tax=Clostridium sp. ZS2-4 TaxID=2987703 RepID=UPI00227D412C|nr:type I restriction-modification enzyme R subunit C-terminal domain-containing protein [Clostridium sp. ZS2-4]MCY6354940.1 hypothetical protein [Clostridium sp. ZS2-4]
MFKNDLENYKKKVSRYLNEHKDEMVVYKLRNNKKLTSQDMKSLEEILWHELGSKEEYEKEYGNLPMTRMVRSIIGLERQAANEAFSEFLGDKSLNTYQSHFVKMIVDYVVKNGFIEKKVLMEDPFRSLGSIVELFKDNMDTAKKILKVIDEINGIDIA